MNQCLFPLRKPSWKEQPSETGVGLRLQCRRPQCSPILACKDGGALWTAAFRAPTHVLFPPLAAILLFTNPFSTTKLSTQTHARSTTLAPVVCIPWSLQVQDQLTSIAHLARCIPARFTLRTLDGVCGSGGVKTRMNSCVVGCVEESGEDVSAGTGSPQAAARQRHANHTHLSGQGRGRVAQQRKAGRAPPGTTTLSVSPLRQPASV